MAKRHQFSLKLFLAGVLILSLVISFLSTRILPQASSVALLTNANAIAKYQTHDGEWHSLSTSWLENLFHYVEGIDLEYDGLEYQNLASVIRLEIPP